MNVEQMKHRCPDAKVEGISELSDYELVFKCSARNAVATIEPRNSSTVPVVIWSISASDEDSLDIYEGYPRLYIKKRLKVVLDGKSISAMAYIMTPGREYGMPSRYYYDTILLGYNHFSLDEKYLKAAVNISVQRIRQEKRDRIKNADQIVKRIAAKQANNTFMICPRCGRPTMKDPPHSNALSRRANIYVCDRCGMEEAIFDFIGEPDPIVDWYIVSNRK